MSNFRLFDLNPEQYRAATHPEGALLILAGAGTGKTRVLTARIAWLVSQGVDPASILAVTFTNKAAREMRERIAAALTSQQAKAMTLCTFHSLCVRLLRCDASLLGYKENFSIFDESDQMGLIKKIASRIHDQKDPINPDLAKNIISKAKNLGSAFPEETGTALGSLFARYQEELRTLNAMDFDDLLLQARNLLSHHPEARARWQERYRFILIDEFQDTNRLQMELITHLVSDPINLCVVGDDDQSIYGWRGAESAHLMEFEHAFPDPEIITLEQNYRSTDLILSTANRLIKNNTRRRKKNLWSNEKEGEPVRVLSSSDDTNEAEFIADEILERKREQSWNQFAVLYRMNAQARLFETALRERKIPYRVVGGKSFFDRREIKDVMAYLSALLNPDDDAALLRVLTTPPRGVGKISLQRLMEVSVQQKKTLFQILQQPGAHDDFSTKVQEAIQRFSEEWEALKIRLQTPGHDPGALLGELLKEVGYYNDLRKSCKKEEEADARENNVRELLQSLTGYCQRSPREGMQGFLDNMLLQREKEEEEEVSDGVTLITLHAAKGLEFSHVYLVGLEDGLLPHERSKQEGTVDEERRLCYVGITRARKTLTITHCRTRKKFGGVISCKPSPFLLEMAGEGVEQGSMEAILSQPLEEEDVGDAFARMRSQIG
ncbi:MAG: UvrD-helicase domain-containing protein [Chthoniobacterales bacterium]|nr:UvrD-helicase domain-containing protein [Chthoniobacterales bacterium]